MTLWWSLNFWICDLVSVINFWNFCSLLLQILLHVFFLLGFWDPNYACFRIFNITPQLLKFLVLFLSLVFLFVFQFGSFLLLCLQVHSSFPCAKFTNEAFKEIFLLLFLISCISTWFYFIILSPHWNYPFNLACELH